VTALRSAADQVRAAALWRAAESELCEAVQAIEVCTRQLNHDQRRVLAEVDSRGAQVVDSRGHRVSAAGLLSGVNLSTAQIRARRREVDELMPARSLAGENLAVRLPATAGAAADGAITREHVRVISSVMKDLPEWVEPALRTKTEEFLAQHARVMDEVGLKRLAAKIRQCYADDADPDAGLKRREFTMVAAAEGGWRVRGHLDEAAHAVVTAALGPLSRPAAADDFGNRDPRSPARRRADALVEVCRRALDGGTLPEAAGEKPHVAITMSLDQLTGAADGAVEANGGSIISASIGRRAACDATIIPVVLGTTGEPLDVGRAHRLVTTALRRAVTIRDKGCVWPGCDRPPEWCDAHHILPWSQGGTTCLANLALACDRHHRAIHADTGYRMRLINGIVHVIAPGGIDPTQTPQRNWIHHITAHLPGDPAP